jgi:transposase-like protein
MEVPTTLLEAVKMYSNEDVARSFFVTVRWPHGVTCPTCGCQDLYDIPERRIYRCKNKEKHPRQEFSAKTGSIFEDSPIGFSKWLPAMWMLSSDRNGISSMELHRSLGVTQKTAWFMLHRIRLAMKSKTFEKLRGPVEGDETLIGAKARGGERPGDHHGRKSKGPLQGKQIVQGLIQRKGDVRAFVVSDQKRSTLVPKIKEHVRPGATIYTDSLGSYTALAKDFYHFVVNHNHEYVRGEIHTNSIEAFWSVLKRTLKGTYIAPRPAHLQRYVEEQVFRFNTRELHDTPRFVRAARGCTGKRITYKTLIDHGDKPTA